MFHGDSFQPTCILAIFLVGWNKFWWLDHRKFFQFVGWTVSRWTISTDLYFGHFVSRLKCFHVILIQPTCILVFLLVGWNEFWWLFKKPIFFAANNSKIIFFLSVKILTNCMWFFNYVKIEIGQKIGCPVFYNVFH